MIATTPALTIQPCSAETLESAFADFRRDYPAYDATHTLDALRATDYARLDRHGHVYLDYTGGNLYPESLVREHMALLKDGVFGNPHSKNLTSLAMTERVEHAREYVLHYFNADPDEYVAIFTPNATGALRLVGESYPFAPGGNYLLTFDNHNSVNGIREFARSRGASVTYIPSTSPDMRVEPCVLQDGLALARAGARHLFAYPAQSNFTGIQHPLEWIAEAQTRGWDVLLDAASFAPANRLDLSRWRPDFVDISFYKIFGYPAWQWSGFAPGSPRSRRTKHSGRLSRPARRVSVECSGSELRAGRAVHSHAELHRLRLGWQEREPARATSLGRWAVERCRRQLYSERCAERARVRPDVACRQSRIGRSSRRS